MIQFSKYYRIVFVSCLSLLAACENKVSETEQAGKVKVAGTNINKRSDVDPVLLQQGRQLYLKNCTVCHGLNAEGATDWRQRNADGKFPAPPLNGTGHAWHHPHSALMDTIKNGTQRLGGNMPPWKDRLNDEEIALIILWFQSQWPDQLYEAWQRVDRESRQHK